MQTKSATRTDRFTTRSILPGDVELIAVDLTPVDRNTIFALFDTGEATNLEDVIAESVRLSGDLVWTVLVDAVPAAIFGAAPMFAPGTGAPWMLCTSAAKAAPKQLTKQGRAFVRFIRKTYPCLINFEDERNAEQLGWLRALGFSVAEVAEPFGPFDLPFRRFWMN